MSDQDGLRWINAGQKDLAVAEFLLTNEYYSAAAFHAQQCAEKALKGLLRLRGHSAWGHNCFDLLRQIEPLLADSVDSAFLTRAQQLDNHYIPSRYPDAFASGISTDHYSEPIARQAVEDAKAILAFVQENKP